MNNGIITASILPNGFVEAHIIEEEIAPKRRLINAHQHDAGDRDVCPICGHMCKGATFDKGGNWLHAFNLTNDSKKPRRYHAACLTDTTERKVAISYTEGCHTKVGEGHTYIVTLRPLADKDNKDLAASLLTPNREAEAGMTDTTGAWFRLPNNEGYISPTLRNLKWQRRLGTVARKCFAAIVTVEVYLDGKYAETITFSWRSRDERSKWVSADNHKHGFLVLLDWEIGKYRNRGKGQYNYPENRERAKVERKGMRFWV